MLTVLKYSLSSPGNGEKNPEPHNKSPGSVTANASRCYPDSVTSQTASPMVHSAFDSSLMTAERLHDAGGCNMDVRHMFVFLFGRARNNF